jgi:hypothetical protein
VNEFIALGGPGLVIAFALGLVMRPRLVAGIGCAAFVVAEIWALTTDRTPEFPLWLIVVIWLLAWFAGLGAAGLVRGSGWLFGFGARGE